MKPRSRRYGWSLAVTVTALAASVAAQEAPRPGRDWPQFRGIQASGVGDTATLPIDWDVASGRHVRWKATVPGLAHSSPIVWGDQVCLTTAVSKGKEESLRVGLYGDIEPVADDTPLSWQVHCFDKRTGSARWSAVAHEGAPRIKRHPKATHANATLATDGRYIIAMFGSEGLYAYDMKGALVWKKDLGVLQSAFFMVPEAQWGFASSPVIRGDRVIVQADVIKDSFLAAFDIRTGRELWRTARTDHPTWSTPTVDVAPGGRAQVIVNGFSHVGGYDLETGKELWRMKGGGDIPVPTPVVRDGLAYITNAHGSAAPILAVRTSASGDVSLSKDDRANAGVAWSQPRDGAYMQTPVVYRGYLYVCRDNGVLSVFDAMTGAQAYQQRLGDGLTGFTASAVAGDGKLYYTSEDGGVVVIKAGPVYEKLAENVFHETAMATPAISEGVLFFRTRTQLVAIGQ